MLVVVATSYTARIGTQDLIRDFSRFLCIADRGGGEGPGQTLVAAVVAVIVFPPAAVAVDRGPAV